MSSCIGPDKADFRGVGLDGFWGLGLWTIFSVQLEDFVMAHVTKYVSFGRKITPYRGTLGPQYMGNFLK